MDGIHYLAKLSSSSLLPSNTQQRRPLSISVCSSPEYSNHILLLFGHPSPHRTSLTSCLTRLSSNFLLSGLAKEQNDFAKCNILDGKMPSASPLHVLYDQNEVLTLADLAENHCTIHYSTSRYLYKISYVVHLLI